jgi:hypothetical protein
MVMFAPFLLLLRHVFASQNEQQLTAIIGWRLDQNLALF